MASSPLPTSPSPSPASPPPPPLGSRLFRIRRTFSLDPQSRIVAMAAHSLERRQLLALAVSPTLSSASSSSSSLRDDPGTHFLLVRSVEEDRRVRHWRFPLAASHAKQQQQRVEPVAALEFSPEGDWLACLSTRKNRLHLVPVATLIATHRRTQLARTYQPPHNREWMSAAPSVMTTPMASYLRATNEAGGLNGARYHSRVAGDDAQMSTLEFAVGMGAATCLCWWRSMNGTDYCLVGGADNIISIVNVQDNAEECRCELQHAGAIESIELFHESFRKEKRTSMLVKTRTHEKTVAVDATPKPVNMSGIGNRSAPPTSPTTTTTSVPAAMADGTVKYYRVVLEKKTLVPSKSPVRPSGSAPDAEAQPDASSLSSSASSFQRFLPRVPTETFVIKTFPEHFVEDMDFRPQRIKKTKPAVRLCAINGLLSSESGLALYDGARQQISVYGNFQWSLKGQYAVPPLRGHGETSEENDSVIDVDIAYCSPDLMLLQGKRAASGVPVATWVSLPSRHAVLDDAPPDDAAHVVHYLSLHDNERVERVLQTRSGASTAVDDAAPDAGTTGEVIYVLQTAHHVYECRPQWSRLALFRALRAKAISLRDALSIGYALGIDMASLCEVVADTLCSDATSDGDADADASKGATDATDVTDATRQWVYDLYDVSRAAPSKAVEQLTRVGGAALAIAYAQRALAQARSADDASDAHETTRERQRVALLAAALVFQQQAQHSYTTSIATTPTAATDSDADQHQPQSTLRPRDAATQSQLEHNDAWLSALLRTTAHDAFATDAMLALCLTHHQTHLAVALAIARDAVSLLLARVVERGVASTLSLASIQSLLDAGCAHALLAPAHRVIWRALPMDTQLTVLLSTSSIPQLLLHRDWLTRHLPRFSKTTCVQLARMLAPLESADRNEETGGMGEEDHKDSKDAATDVASSEYMPATSAERVELFLTLLLRINYCNDSEEEVEGEEEELENSHFSQAALETYLRDLAFQYRPPIMITRCVDYGNWNAAASLHEAHGELVDAVECRLQSHQRVIQTRRQRQRRPVRRVSSKVSMTEEGNDEDEDGDQDDGELEDQEDQEEDQEEPADDLAAIRAELLRMVDALVLHTATPTPTPTASASPTSTASASLTGTATGTGVVSETTRAAILARVLVKWFEYGLARADLEVYLIDSSVFAHVASPLARIFFSDLIARVGGKGLHPSQRLATSNGHDDNSGFDERDKAWIRRCHALPFSGQFLFHVCTWLLDQDQDQDQNHSVGDRPRLRDVALDNIAKNDLAVRAVRIAPHAAPAIGKSDPLETHVKAFTCGHFFPKRVFDEDVVPEFESRMTALPTPLFATKQLLLTEFKRSRMEAPCPVCAFNKISQTVFQQQHTQQQSKEPKATRAAEAAVSHPSCYFLHDHVAPSAARPSPFGMASSSASASIASGRPPPPLQHDEWEWRGTATAS